MKDNIRYVESVIGNEINSATDNPNVFPDEDMDYFAGNFHGEPIAIPMDTWLSAMSELSNISERRIYKLISGQRGLPMFLVAKPGLNSGFMIPQYTAASIVSQNKMLCWPASCDSIPSSQGQEDHVSMGSNSATKLVRGRRQCRDGSRNRVVQCGPGTGVQTPGQVIASHREAFHRVPQGRTVRGCGYLHASAHHEEHRLPA